mgnify:CR=1 FL=1
MRFKYCSYDYLEEIIGNNFVTDQGKDLEQYKDSILEEFWRKQREKDENMFQELEESHDHQ